MISSLFSNSLQVAVDRWMPTLMTCLTQYWTRDLRLVMSSALSYFANCTVLYLSVPRGCFHGVLSDFVRPLWIVCL